MPELPRPEVVLVRSSLPPRLAPAPVAARRPRRAWELLTMTGFVLLLAGTSAPAAQEAPAPEVSAVLVAQPEALTLSQGGVLVLPLELRNPGSAVEVVEARAYAEPVVDDALVQAPDAVAAGGLRRFVALVAPDCRLLRPGSPIAFRATVQLRVATHEVAGRRASGDLVVDLGDLPQVRDTVAGLCG